MTDVDPAAHSLDVPGARLYYERRGSGPLLLLLGSPMDSARFAGLARALADRHTVVTYDPRGIGNSTREDATSDLTPEQQADDVRRLLEALDGGPVDVFASSGGAVVGLALVTAHPDLVRTLVAHEPPVVDVLADRAQVHAQVEHIYDTYRTHGPERAKAMHVYMVHAGVAAPPTTRTSTPPREPSTEERDRKRAKTHVYYAHLLRPTTRYRPDIEKLCAASTRIVIGCGATSKGQLASRAAVALAARLGVSPVEFPGDHLGFVPLPEECAEVLHHVLQETP
ncbi:alpha/beta fold hydrolase [Phytohabitans houttuyneae]|uniref:Hydrolase n=1 Tax=Phytohabitans houttuyneae TaxID=1076126 RepID=A0A6V8KEF1_9ACTN|nr:alpha/beta fold hydrolase [Phytohabitans houttuyneae]GFJ81810.1 hydrolase [Phytohabitans houttuyneae]